MKLVFDDGTEVELENVKTLDAKQPAVVVITMRDDYEMARGTIDYLEKIFEMPVITLPFGSTIDVLSKAVE